MCLQKISQCVADEDPQLTGVSLQDLFVMADKYQTIYLTAKCEIALMKSINCDTVIVMWQLGNTHNNVKLKKSCFDFIVDTNSANTH